MMLSEATLALLASFGDLSAEHALWVLEGMGEYAIARNGRIWTYTSR